MFIVLEIQSTGDTAATLTETYAERDNAESKFHQILTHAAISDVPIHTAALMFDTGKVIKSETYRHDANKTEPSATDQEA